MKILAVVVMAWLQCTSITAHTLPGSAGRAGAVTPQNPPAPVEERAAVLVRGVFYVRGSIKVEAPLSVNDTFPGLGSAGQMMREAGFSGEFVDELVPMLVNARADLTAMKKARRAGTHEFWELFARREYVFHASVERTDMMWEVITAAPDIYSKGGPFREAIGMGPGCKQISPRCFLCAKGKVICFGRRFAAAYVPELENSNAQ
jgi:hypothetical protein